MNACIVGYGAIGPKHAAAIENAEGAELYAVCDTNTERAKKCTDKYGCVAYDNFDDVLNDNKVDCVHICTPHWLHCDMICRALEAGKHVVVEKPAVMKRSEMRLVEEAEKKSAAKLCCIVQNRENLCLKKLKEIVESGKEGNLKGICANMRWNRNMEYYNKDEWRGKWETEGGGLIINQAIHLIDIICWLCGDISFIKCAISNRGLPEIEVEDTADAYIVFKSGTVGIFTATNTYPVNLPFMLELNFENGTYRYCNSELTAVHNGNAEVIEHDADADGEKAYWGRGHNAAIAKFYSALSGNDVEYTKFKDVKKSLECVFEFYEQGGKNL